MATNPSQRQLSLSHGVAGTVSVPHFEPGYKHARHYIGWAAGDVTARVAVHLQGRGSPLVRAAVKAGVRVQLAATYPCCCALFSGRSRGARSTSRPGVVTCTSVRSASTWPHGPSMSPGCWCVSAGWRVADRVGLTAALSGELGGLRKRDAGHDPGRVIRDLAVMLADGGDCLADLRAVRDQADLFGSVASDSTAFRVIDKIASTPGMLDAFGTRTRRHASGSGSSPGHRQR